ncbi:MAG: CsgE family curli-type amyloid fiber assembly protein [Cyclonatronaceae bacterium]
MTFRYFFHIILIGVLFTSARASEARDTVMAEGGQPCIEEKTTYMIQPGDRLFSIGRQFGSGHFWEAIYIMNAEKITNPHYIYPGQVITIPYYIANFFEYGLPLQDVLNQPFCTTGEIAEIDWNAVDYEFLYRYDRNEMSTLSAMARAAVQQQGERMADRRATEDADTLGQEVDEATLQAFRDAFEELISQEEEEQRREQAQAESERSMFIEIDGMIHDDTRSKIGRDFYDIFYANWKSPPEASNYSIRITEQPAPNLGTVIAVEVNNTVTFRSRLQPRYDFIEEASQYAVRRTYMHLQHNQQQIQIY